MTQYNQFSLSNGVVAEVSDQSVYFEYDTGTPGFAIALYYPEFEEAYKYYSRGETGVVELTDEVMMDVSDSFVHLITNVLTVSFPRDELDDLYEFYEGIRPELQDPGRKAVLVWEDERLIAESRYASEDVVDEVVEELQSEYSDEYKLEVTPATEFQGR